jgi:hypothetical protein
MSGSDGSGLAMPVVSVAVGLSKVFMSLGIQLSHSCVDLPKRPICCSATLCHSEWSVITIKLIKKAEVTLDIDLQTFHSVREIASLGPTSWKFPLGVDLRHVPHPRQSLELYVVTSK